MTRSRSNDTLRRRPVWKTRLGMLLGGLLIVGLSVGIRYLGGTDSAQADLAQPSAARAASAAPVAQPGSPAAARAATAARASAVAPAAPASQHKIVAQVNGVQITRDELAAECLRHHGKEVLESMVNKYLIAEECKRCNTVVSRGEVDAEIERMSKRFNLPVEQWLQMLKQERGIKPVQYASDIIWPTLALRKLAGDRLKVSQEELKAAYEMHYGPSVRCRLIAVRDAALAEQIRASASANPESFGDLAKKYSEDSSASVKGVIPPIRRHGSFPEVEQAAFGIKDGEISPVIEAGGQFVLLQRETLLPGNTSIAFAQVAPQLEEIVRERKMRTVAAEIFQQLQKASRVENVMNDPAKSRAMPGVAATINGVPLTLREVAEQCTDRHGEEVLEGLINRRLLELACKKQHIAISDKDLDEEVVRAAAEMLAPRPDGSPDVEGWIRTVTEQQNTTEEIYRSDAVWPAVALKKLVGNAFEVTREDLDKGFEANYGPRVRCRAIVLNNARRAQEVWEMARRKLTVENFGNLAEAYSIEPGSQALRGEVPPIQRHGGQPLLEKAAFAMKPGELSEIIQVGDKWVILLCEGYTQQAVEVTFDEVRDEIYRDLFEKKQRIEMARCFEALKDAATIDNYVAGTSTSPQQKRAGEVAAQPAARPAGPEPQRPAAIVGSRPMTLKMK